MSAGIRLSKVAFDAEHARQAGRRLYMCRHSGRAPEVTLAEIAARHDLDVALQRKYDVRWLTYYVNPRAGTSFCLAEAPSQEAVEGCHREAHGLARPYRVSEVDWSAVEAFLGSVMTPDQGYPWAESPIRTIVVLSVANPLGMALRVGAAQLRQIFDELLARAAEAMGVADPAQVERTPSAIIASFASAGRAVASALAIVEGMAGRAPVRAGISAGEPLSSPGSLFGATVQLAYELSLHAPPGSVVVSSAARDLCVGNQVCFAERGTLRLDGVGDVRICVAGRGATLESRCERFSGRDQEVLRMLAAGRTDQDIAADLEISPGTLDGYVADILNKTGASNRTEAVAFGYRERLI